MTGRAPILSLSMPASGLKRTARMVVGRKTSPASTGVMPAMFTMKSGRMSVMPMNDALSRFCATKLTTYVRDWKIDMEMRGNLTRR